MAKRKSKEKRFKYIISIVLVFVAAVGFFLSKKDESSDVSVPSDDRLSVSFVDVGQGDCTVIFSKKDGVILIDSGESFSASKVISFLSRLGVKKLDYCIVTHQHTDHMGSMSRVLARFHADKLIMPELSEINTPTNSTYIEFMSAVKRYAKEVLPAVDGDVFTLGEIKIEIYGPISQTEDLNNMSVVSKIIYGDTSFLITGDCSFDEEDEILSKYKNELDCDVLKIGHHGSYNATSSEWLNAVKPEVGVISVGANNDYGHPHEKLLNRLKKYKLKYYTTEKDGTVTFKTDGKKYEKV